MSTVMSRFCPLCPLVIAVGLAASCRTPPPSFDPIAEGYVRTTLKLAQHDPSLVEDWRGPEAWRPGPRVPVARLLDEIAALERQLATARSDISSGREYARGRYLAAQLKALRFAAERQLGRATSIDEQAGEEFGVTFPPFDAAAAERARERLGRLLPGEPPLADRVAAFRRHTIVPADRREDIVRAAMLPCMQAVGAVAGALQHEGIQVTFRSDLSWDAFARYDGSADNRETTIEINDAPLDIARAMRLACHEGFGGHHTQHVWIDALSKKRSWLELQLAPGFGPHLLMTEGAAEIAADVALSRHEREALLRDSLLPLAGLPPALAPALVEVDAALIQLLPVVTDVARQYLDGTITRERALERLGAEALVTNPAGTLAFIEQRRARALVYGEGRRVVHELMTTRDLAGLFAAFKAAAAIQ